MEETELQIYPLKFNLSTEDSDSILLQKLQFPAMNLNKNMFEKEEKEEERSLKKKREMDKSDNEQMEFSSKKKPKSKRSYYSSFHSSKRSKSLPLEITPCHSDYIRAPKRLTDKYAVKAVGNQTGRRGRSLIGETVRVKWEDGQWHVGVILTFAPRTKEYAIQYDKDVILLEQHSSIYTIEEQKKVEMQEGRGEETTHKESSENEGDSLALLAETAFKEINRQNDIPQSLSEKQSNNLKENAKMSRQDFGYEAEVVDITKPL